MAMAPFGSTNMAQCFRRNTWPVKNTGIYIAALLLFLGGVGYLAYSGFSENSVYFLNVSEAKAATPALINSWRRVFWHSGRRGHWRTAPGVSFRLEDKDNASQTIK